MVFLLTFPCERLASGVLWMNGCVQYTRCQKDGVSVETCNTNISKTLFILLGGGTL